MKVCMLPRKADLGIGRVVEGYQKHASKHGIEYVSKEEDADIIAVHAGNQPTTRQPDVHHCHGLYPTAHEDKGKEKLYEYNAYVIENARVSRVITVPTEWVADIFRRDMHVEPIVLPHGIDIEDWPYVGGSIDNPILWAKGHSVGVCDPNVLTKLARKLPDRSFVTTFGDELSNIQVVGKQPHPEMINMLKGCGIYLAVTKETFGIQTLEAMALGKPILGYDWGGTGDIVTHLVDGYLAEPGDVDDLALGLEWIAEYYDDVSRNARLTVEASYDWDSVVAKLAIVYELADGQKASEFDVSIVIPCYNYGHRVNEAIESALGQAFTGSFEIIVVNDGSTDNSLEVIQRYTDRVTVVDIENSGVAEARNVGIRHAVGEFITCLDSDDLLYQGTIQRFYDAISADRGMGIVYGALYMTYSDTGMERKAEWPPEFCFDRQRRPKSNQVPSCNMMRKEAWRRAGGFRANYTPTEDADLWTRITALGFGAKKITEDVVYQYDAHEGSLSRTKPDVDYMADKPWSYMEDLVPFAAPACNYKYESYAVRNYDRPWVSIVIPVGPGHEHIVWRALDSVWLQSLPNWECIVVPNGCGELVQPSTGSSIEEAYPWVKIIRLDEGNVSRARNVGAEHGKGDLLTFLDADDYFMPDYLLATVHAYNDSEGAYVYTDYYSQKGGPNELQASRASPFNCENLKKEALHTVTALVPRTWHEEVGGFDEDLSGWEDWDYYLKLALVGGYCGIRIPEPLIVYDAITGTRRDDSFIRKDELLPIIRERYKDIMCRSGCGQSSNVNVQRSMAVATGLPQAVIARVMPEAVGIGGRPAVQPINKVAAMGRAAPIPNKPTNRVQEDNNMDGQFVKVIENSGNYGRHGVVGMATRKNYGMLKHGDQFEMRQEDWRLQPHVYIRVGMQKEEPRKVQRPEPPRSVSRPGDNGRVPTAPPKLDVEDIPEEEAQPYNADADGINISVLPLYAIKKFGVNGDAAAAAYEQEMDGQNREDVLEYLETRFEVEKYFELVEE